jgi:hypothetical protein
MSPRRHFDASEHPHRSSVTEVPTDLRRCHRAPANAFAHGRTTRARAPRSGWTTPRWIPASASSALSGYRSSRTLRTKSTIETLVAGLRRLASTAFATAMCGYHVVVRRRGRAVASPRLYRSGGGSFARRSRSPASQSESERSPTVNPARHRQKSGPYDEPDLEVDGRTGEGWPAHAPVLGMRPDALIAPSLAQLRVVCLRCGATIRPPADPAERRSSTT